MEIDLLMFLQTSDEDAASPLSCIWDMKEALLSPLESELNTDMSGKIGRKVRLR